MKKKIFIFGVSLIALLSSAVFSQVTISGTVTSGGSGLANVIMSGLSGNPTTDSSGFYTATVTSDWSGTVTPTLAGYTFVPPATTYTNISTNQTTDYTATKHYFTIESVLIPAERRANPIAIIPVDFNSDSSMDFLVTQMSGGDFLPVPVLAFRNDGTGHFAEVGMQVLGDLQTTGVGPYAVADFNGDGLKDVFLADWGRDAEPFSGGQNIMLIQKPDGTLANETASRLPQFKDVSGGATHGDYDNDGDVDILVLGGGGEAPASGYLLINDGLGHFVVDRERLPSEIKKFLGCTTLDADKDGNLDLAIGCTGWGTGKDRDSILINDGLGRFSFMPLATLPPRWDGRLTDGNVTQSTDFNGDGWPDLVFHIDQWRDGYDINHVQLLFNNQDGTFRDASGNIAQPTKMGLGGNYNRFADFNNDGWMDLMLGRGKSLLYINKGNGVFEDISSIVLDQRTLENNDYGNGVPVDVDNDGDMDFVTARQDNTCIDIYRQQFPYDSGAVPLPLPAAPTLLSPAAGGSASGMDVLLDWDDVGTAFSYQVQASTQADFSSPALDKSGITSSFWRAGKLAGSTSYYWRVRATNTRGAGPWSASRSFSTPSAHTISGQITTNGSGLPGVVLEGLPGNPQTDATGHYSARVENGWSGTVMPAFPGYNFTPTSTVYSAVGTDKTTAYTSYKGLPWQERAALIAFYQSLDGEHWTNNSGWKTAPLEADGFATYGSEGGWYGLKVEANTVTQLDMSGNPLLGSLPAELGDLKNIDFLRLGGDGIDGILPDSFARLTNLNYLRIGCTRITGSLPNYFGNFRFLSNLDLANTSFSGTFPDEICDLIELRYLYIGDCALRGPIPTCLTNLPLLENDAVFSYNALYTSDAALRTFLNEKDPDWESTQTIAPANLQATVNGGTVNLTWTPITYSTGSGSYRVLYSTTSGGPYTFYGQTADKTSTGMAVTGLTPGIPYYFVVQTRSNTWFCHEVILDSDLSSEVTATTISEETVSAPAKPAGPTIGTISTSYDYSTGGSTSSLGHSVQYLFDWDDGTTSGWLAEGRTSASHSWAANGTYDVRAMARCADHTSIESLWSETHAIIISDSGTLGKYNSPAQQKILPEVIWSPATGGGTWMSEVQVTDLSGGSQVSVYYSTAAGRRGPFLLWNNSGGALCSQKYSNMLQTIDGLDGEVFTYDGTVGRWSSSPRMPPMCCR